MAIIVSFAYNDKRTTRIQFIQKIVLRKQGKIDGWIPHAILKRTHGKAAPKTNYQDTKPTGNPTSKTLLY